MIARIVTALALFALVGCGGTSTRTAGSKRFDAPPKLPPVAPRALAEFDAGLRALRNAGEPPRPAGLERAKARFVRAVELDSKVWEAWHNLGAIHFLEGDDTAAVDAFGKALAVNPAHVEAVLGRAEAHRRAGNGKDAGADYRRVLERTSDESPLRRTAATRLASLLRDQRKYDEALDVLRETLRTVGADARVYVELGQVYFAQGRDDLARLALSKAAELDAQLPTIYNALALIALHEGKSQEAFDKFDQATSLDPDYIDARFNKASVLLSAGDYTRAKRELEAVLERAPDDLAAMVALGVAQRGLREYDRAEATWERVVEIAPRRSSARSDALFNLAILKVDFQEDEKSAAALLDRFLQIAPGDHPKRKAAEEKKKELGL